MNPDLPNDVRNLGLMIDQSYQILCALFTDAPIIVDGQTPIMPGDPRRNDMIIEISHCVHEYQRVTDQYDLPDWMFDKYMFLLTLLRWLLNPNDELVIELEYNPNDFGEDVEKTGYTPAEIRKFIRKRPLNKLRLGTIEQPSCTICLEMFDPTEEVARLNCYHVFHDECVQGWLKHNKTCPLCVTDISKKPAPKKKRPAQPRADMRQSKRLRGLPPSPVK
jgi:hypothetical protein